MTSIRTDMRATFVGLAACMAAAFLMAQLPYVALLLCALVLTDMTLRGRPVLAAFVAGATSAATAVLWGPGGALIAVTGLTGVLVAIALIDRADAWRVLLVLAIGYGVSFVAVDVVGAWLAGESFLTSMNLVAQANGEIAASAARAVGIESGTIEAKSVSEMLYALWPANYAATAMVTAMLVMSGISRVARRRGKHRTLPPLTSIDLSPHVLWLPIAAVSCLVAGKLVWGGSDVMTALGSNLLVVAWPLFAWQGVAVVAGKLAQTKATPVVRAVVYACVFVFEVMMFAVSLLGFVDIVANFRKLERADSASQEGAKGPASSS